jgi:predicted histidine transporter YuiF (NhaC family)
MSFLKAVSLVIALLACILLFLLRYLYIQAPDGFKGTYAEVLAHEMKIGRKYDEVTGKEVFHDDGATTAQL